MSVIKTTGADLQKIANKAYAKYATDKGEKIALALEKSRIPYFANREAAAIRAAVMVREADAMDAAV